VDAVDDREARFYTRRLEAKAKLLFNGPEQRWQFTGIRRDGGARRGSLKIVRPPHEPDIEHAPQFRSVGNRRSQRLAQVLTQFRNRDSMSRNQRAASAPAPDQRGIRGLKLDG